MKRKNKALQLDIEMWYTCLDNPEPGYSSARTLIYEANTLAPTLGMYIGSTSPRSGVSFYYTLVPLLF